MFKINFGSDFWSPFDFSTGQLLEGQLRRLAGGTVDRPEFVHSYNCRLETEGTNRALVDSIIADAFSKDCERELLIGSSHQSGNTVCTLYTYSDDQCVLLQVNREQHKNNKLYVRVYAVSTNEELLKRMEVVNRRFEELNEPEKESICVADVYWNGPHGPNSIKVKLDCPTWNEIEANYSSLVQESFQEMLFRIKNGNVSGKLILWQGSPGTGKTWAVRALMRELKSQFRIAIITDSNAFCDDISYYYYVIQSSDKPTLFILEDSAESILSETRIHNGHRTSKLLNLTDGLLAQGRRDLFLISFNEPKIEIDPAFTRPGRCINVTEFGPLDAQSAKKWLEKKGVTKPLTKTKYTLAELYDMAGHIEQRLFTLAESCKVGFAVDSPALKAEL